MVVAAGVAVVAELAVGFGVTVVAVAPAGAVLGWREAAAGSTAPAAGIAPSQGGVMRGEPGGEGHLPGADPPAMPRLTAEAPIVLMRVVALGPWRGPGAAAAAEGNR